MGMLKEFKEFALKGNLVDMAIAFVMGGAFGKVVTAFIDGMVMPAVGMLTGGVDFNDMKIVLKEAGKDAAGKEAIVEGVVKPITEESSSHPGIIRLAQGQHVILRNQSHFIRTLQAKELRMSFVSMCM